MAYDKNLPRRLDAAYAVSGLALLAALSSVRGRFDVHATGEKGVEPLAFVVYVDGRRSGPALTFPRLAEAERVRDECRAAFDVLRGIY